VDVVINYAVPRAAGATAPIRAPVLPLREAGYQSLNLRAAPATGVRLASGSTGWTPVPTPLDALVWSSTTAASEVLLEIDPSVASSRQRLAIDDSLILVRLHENGAQDVHAEYQLSQRPEALSVSLPAAAGPPRVLINGVPLAASQLTRSAAQVGDWVLSLPDQETTPGSGVRVTFDYQAPSPAAGRGICQFELLAPEFAEGVWPHRTLWELQLPPDLHLWQSPAGLTRLFRWTRIGLSWRRTATSAAQMLRTRLVQDPLDMGETPSDGEHHAYLYRSSGPTPGLKLGAISRSMLVLFGTGLTLLVSFVLWLLPVLRNAVTAAALAFGVALAGLWFSEPIELLVQPALLGLALATTATGIDTFVRRRRSTAPRLMRRPVRPTVLAAADGMRSTIVRTGSEVGSAR
jgi:hypothetical protein